MKSDPLYVPIILEALVVSSKSDNFAELVPQYNHLRFMPLSNITVNQFFQEKTELPGIHLHWTMPDALLRGVQNETIEFPSLPNRWVVQRLQYKKDQILRKAWIIESDFVTNDNAETPYGMSKTSLPTLKLEDGLWVGAGNNNQLYGYQGDVRELGTAKTASGYYLDQLTAVGPGDTTFAAFYPKCQSVFGFYDSMEDNEEGVFTYLVDGYYEDCNQDPLNKDVENTLEEYSWVCKEMENLPDCTVCHGLVKGVTWYGKDYQYPSSIPEEDIDIAIGNTSAEALSALIRDNIPDAADLERILNAMQYNLLSILDNQNNPDALIDFEELIHEKMFSSELYGYHWTVRKDKDAEESCKDMDNELPLKINDINELQSEVDSLMAKNTTLVKELYFNWWKYVSIKRGPGVTGVLKNAEYHFSGLLSDRGSGTVDSGIFIDQLQMILGQIKMNHETINKNNTAIANLDSYINERLKEAHLLLVKEEAYRCYISNPPAVLLAGEGVRRSFKQGTQTNAAEQLPCRRNTLDTITVTIQGKDVSLFYSDLSQKDKNPQERLLVEAILLDTNARLPLAALALSKLGISYSEDDLSDAANQLQAAQAELALQSEAPFDISNKDWSQPWNPMLMEWELEIHPARKNISEDDSFSQFKLGEMDFENESYEMTAESWKLQGTTLILPHAVTNMYDMLNKLIADYGEEEQDYDLLQKVMERLKNSDILSQQLDGFHEALLMQDMYPFIPACAIDNNHNDLLRDINSYLNQYVSSPRVGSNSIKFLPVRAGMAKLSQIWIVDSFGQRKRILLKDDKLHIAESMQLANEKSGALLRPRFMQACGMRFQWLSFQDESIEAVDSRTTPVFGYIVPNFLDHNLQVYNSEGCMLGFLQTTEEGSRWMSSPGTRFDYTDIEEEHLKEFVESLITKDASLHDFLVCLDHSLNSILPSNEDPFLQLCFGKVLALTRASIHIFEKEERAHVQLWDTQQPCNQYDQEIFKVRLGDIRKVEDGLVGFYLGASPKNCYQHMYSSLQESVGASGYIIPQNAFDMTLAEGGKELTLLLNPSGDITIRTGFLPTKKVTLPSVFYDKHMSNFQYLLRTMPVLVQPELFSIPLPGNLDKTWSFFLTDTKDSLIEIKDIKTPVQKLPESKQRIMEGYLKADNKVKWNSVN